ncbi:hypothetical protein BKA70DRAFT_1268971 [Coprinopsis sp. MPI-PUGE-AT-0042]|nr:hypothetical protein BKA70DRAFT_1268971 [Coprinopsis sp. MPI-PUGE-AT-0042]
MTHVERGPVRAALVHQARAANAPSILHQPLEPHTILQSFMDVEPNEGDGAVGSSNTTGDHDLSAQDPGVVPIATQPSNDEIDAPSTSTNTAPVSRVPTTSVDAAALPAAVQRKMIGLSKRQIQKVKAGQVTEKASRQPRHCKKCGSEGEIICGGRRSVALCSMPCQDCGKVECLGRDPKLERPCWEVRERREKKLVKKRKRDT